MLFNNGIIPKARKLFNNETLSSLYYSFVYPYMYINYCIHIWGKAYDTHLHHLIVLQNKAIRVINAVPPRTNVDSLYVMQNILSVKRIYSYNVGVFMYKYSGRLLPDVFDNFFTRLADVHGYNTRNASTQHLYVSFRGTTRGQKTLSYCGARIRNYILDNIDPDCAIGTFKKHIQILLNSKDDLFTWFSDNFRYLCINDNHVSCTYVYPRVCMCIYVSVWGIHVLMHVLYKVPAFWTDGIYSFIYFVLHS